MSRYLHTHICVGWIDPVEASKAQSLGIGYEPERNIRRACIDLLLVDHYTEAESDIQGDMHPTVILQMANGERMPILMKYEDFTPKIDQARESSEAMVYQLSSVNTAG